MKYFFSRLSILLILITVGTLTGNCQLTSTFTRGHTSDDLYIYTATESPFTGRSLLYLTMDGKNISTQNNTNILYSSFIVAEMEPGLLYGSSNQYFGESTDNGKNFNFVAPFINGYTSINGMYGGELPGEYVIDGVDQSIWPGPGQVIYKTTDYFAHFTLIADSSTGIYFGETGHISGELFQMPIINKHAFLTHSLDFGATSDTIAIGTSIINENTGLFFKALSRGAAQGELFLVTKQTVSAAEIHYYIYHTNDYGASWQLKSSPVFDSDLQQFTAGRGDCKFYIANLQTIANSTYYKLQIMYSSDCGETFTTYEHLLTPDVGLAENSISNYNKLTISPDPATDRISLHCMLTQPSEIAVAVYNSIGKCVLLTGPAWETTELSKTINIANLAPGVYSIQLQSKGSSLATAKFIISR